MKNSPGEPLQQINDTGADSIFRQLFEQSADAQLLLAEDRFIDCNHAAVEMLGYNGKAAVLSLHPHDISPERQPDGRFSSEKADELIAQAYRQGTLRFEWVHQRPDGQSFPVEILLTAIHLEGKRYLHSAWHDISERKQAEKALRRSKQTLEQRVEERTGEVQALFKVQQALTSRLDLDAVLQLIADEARRLTAARHGAVYLLDGDEFEIAVVSGQGPPDLVGYRFPVSDSVSGLVVRTKQPFLAPDAGQEPRAYADLVKKIEANSFLVVPLLSGEKAIGVITVADKATGALAERDERVLTMLASSAVIGLENARIYQAEHERRLEAERRRRVAEGLSEVLAILNSTRSLDEILEYIVSQVRRLLKAEAAAIYRLQTEVDQLVIQAAQGLDAEFRAINIPVGQGVVGLVTQTRQPVVIPDIVAYVDNPSEATGPLSDPPLAGQIADRFQAVLAAPIVVNTEIYGAIILYYPTPRSFSEEDVSLTVTLGDQAALAIENARLRTQAEQTAVAAERSRLARDLHDAVTQTLFSANLIAEVLPDAWTADPEEGRQLLGELRQLNRGALAEMRTLLLELRPSAVVETRLDDLLRQLADAVTGRTGLPVNLDLSERQDIPEEVHLALYRIAQEALNNVVKHARASQVSVTCTVLPEPEAGDIEQIALVICDDGRGFDLEQSCQHRLGLDIMEERAAAIEAVLAVKSNVGEGTEVAVVWRPMTKDQGRRNERHNPRVSR